MKIHTGTLTVFFFLCVFFHCYWTATLLDLGMTLLLDSWLRDFIDSGGRALNLLAIRASFASDAPSRENFSGTLPVNFRLEPELSVGFAPLLLVLVGPVVGMREGSLLFALGARGVVGLTQENSLLLTVDARGGVGLDFALVFPDSVEDSSLATVIAGDAF